MLYAALWLAASNRALGHGGADSSMPTDEPATVAAGPAGTWSTLFAHPLGPPLGAASFMLTFVWVLTEFLCFARYQQVVDPVGAPRVPGTDLRLAAAGGVRLHRAVRRARHPLGPADLAQRDLPGRRAPEPAVDESGGQRALGRRRSHTPTRNRPRTRCSIRPMRATSRRFRSGCKQGCGPQPRGSAILWGWRPAAWCFWSPPRPRATTRCSLSC